MTDEERQRLRNNGFLPMREIVAEYGSTNGAMLHSANLFLTDEGLWAQTANTVRELWARKGKAA